MDTGRMLKEIEAEIAKLQSIARVLREFDGSTPNGTTGRTLSAAARRKISLAQKKRWAKTNVNGNATSAKPKRTLSASARKRIADAQRARWAKVRAQAKKAA